MATYLEKTDDNAIANFSFDITGGSCKSYYYVQSSDAQNLQATITDILGTTDPDAASGRLALNRTLPKRHPKFPYLYASRISSLTGVGTGTATSGASNQTPTNPSLPALNGPPISNYQQYTQYEIGVEFTGPRTYAIADNNIMENQSGSWMRPIGGSPQTYQFAPEFLRYTDFDFVPQDNTIQGQQGGVSLWRPDFVPPQTSNIPFTSPPWMWLPDVMLKITWYQVPYRYILSANSYIAASPWRGRVNQNYMWLWPPGWLLYMGYNVKKYAPPTGYAQVIKSNGYSELRTGGTPTPATEKYAYFNYAQLCDIELNFLMTNRFDSSGVTGTPTNKNYVVAGHNLLPDLVKSRFLYATRNNDQGQPNVNNPPPWLSAPLEVLFTDPDIPGGPDRV
jgi:hypothetical protein